MVQKRVSCHDNWIETLFHRTLGEYVSNEAFHKKQILFHSNSWFYSSSIGSSTLKKRITRNDLLIICCLRLDDAYRILTDIFYWYCCLFRICVIYDCIVLCVCVLMFVLGVEQMPNYPTSEKVWNYVFDLLNRVLDLCVAKCTIFNRFRWEFI